MIRKARIEDIPRIIELVNMNLETLLPRSEADYKDLIDTTWVAVHKSDDNSERVVGSCLMEVYSPKIAEIRSFVVHSDYRGLGYGKALIDTAVAEGRSRNIREIMVVTSSREYFEKLNFGACLHEKYALFWNGK